MVKILKLFLWDQKFDDLENQHGPLETQCLQDINDDPGLTTRSNLVKLAYCADFRPICQVSVYRNIGPLVFFL